MSPEKNWLFAQKETWNAHTDRTPPPHIDGAEMPYAMAKIWQFPGYLSKWKITSDELLISET